MRLLCSSVRWFRQSPTCPFLYCESSSLICAPPLGKKKRKRKKKNKENWKTSCAEAIYCQRFPCPAFQYCNGSLEISRGVASKEALSCRLKGLSVRPSLVSGKGGVGKIAGCMYRFPLYSTGHYLLCDRFPIRMKTFGTWKAFYRNISRTLL